MERWTIITEDGLLMWREDIFTEAEARQVVADNPVTADGTPQLAVTTTQARHAQKLWHVIGARLENRKKIERTEAVLRMLDITDKERVQ